MKQGQIEKDIEGIERQIRFEKNVECPDDVYLNSLTEKLKSLKEKLKNGI